MRNLNRQQLAPVVETDNASGRVVKTRKAVHEIVAASPFLSEFSLTENSLIVMG